MTSNTIHIIQIITMMEKDAEEVLKMTQEKTREELTQEARDFESRNADTIKENRYWTLDGAAKRWHLAGDAEKAKKYWILAAENVTGYWDERDYRRGLMYERAGELGKAIESFEEAIRLYTRLEGSYDLHGDPRPGMDEAGILRRRVEKLQGMIEKGTQLDMEEIIGNTDFFTFPI